MCDDTKNGNEVDYSKSQIKQTKENKSLPCLKKKKHNKVKLTVLALAVVLILPCHSDLLRQTFGVMTHRNEGHHLIPWLACLSSKHQDR